MAEGYVKLFRKMLTWKWYDEPDTRAVFIHCLLKANYEETKWHDITIPRGSFITSISKMSEELGITPRSVRTAITRLISTSELTSETTNRFTIINVANWRLYQVGASANDKQNDKPIDNQTTSQRQTNDKQTTTVKEIKNIRIEEVKNKEQEIDADFSALALTDTDLFKLLQDFKDMRMRIKKPLTDNAKHLLCKKLQGWRTQGVDIAEVLQNSIINGWQGVFLPDERKPNGRNAQPNGAKIDWLKDYQDNITNGEKEKRP